MPKVRPNILLGFCQRKVEETEGKEFLSEKRASPRTRDRRIWGQECACVVISAESLKNVSIDSPVTPVPHSSVSITRQ